VALILARAGYSFNGLWKILERSVIWHTVRMTLNHYGLGVAVLLTVLLFAWKGYGAIKDRSREKIRK
jgi:hypothetical protein